MALAGGDPIGFPVIVHHLATEMLVLPQVLHVRPGKSEEISLISSSVASSKVPFGLKGFHLQTERSGRVVVFLGFIRSCLLRILVP